MAKQLSIKSKPVPARSEKQPEQCKGCVWGDWTGTKQICSFISCQRDKKNEKNLAK